MKNQKTVWISRAMKDSTLIKGFTCDEVEAGSEAVIDAIRRNKRGEPLPADRFPKKLYVSKFGKKYGKLPDICNAGGFWIVSSACVEVLSRFNLGQTSLYPTDVFQVDKETRVEGEYFHINFGESKKAFEPDLTPNVSVASPLPNPEPTGYWDLRAGFADGDVAVNRTVLEGPDLWMDPSLPWMFFLSDDLVQALKKAKVTRRFGLKKCRIVA